MKMKEHLFYTFLAIFVATAIVTLLGIIGVVRVGGGYLTALVTAFLVELAGAVVAIFRRAEFFGDDKQEYQGERARLKVEHADALKRVGDSASLADRFQNEIERLRQENQRLGERLERVDSLRLRILAVLGSVSADRSTLLRELNLGSNTPESNLALSVIGKLVDDEEIEQDPYKPSGYYRLRRT